MINLLLVAVVVGCPNIELTFDEGTLPDINKVRAIEQRCGELKPTSQCLKKLKYNAAAEHYSAVCGHPTKGDKKNAPLCKNCHSNSGVGIPDFSGQYTGSKPGSDFTYQWDRRFWDYIQGK